MFTPKAVSVSARLRLGLQIWCFPSPAALVFPPLPLAARCPILEWELDLEQETHFVERSEQ